MLRSCCLRCLGRRNGDGLLWHTDLKPHASGEFSIAVVQANSSLEDQSQVYTSPSATYVGVYDGHGGPEASRFVNRHLFPYLHSNFLKSPFRCRSFLCFWVFAFLCICGFVEWRFPALFFPSYVWRPVFCLKGLRRACVFLCVRVEFFFFPKE